MPNLAMCFERVTMFDLHQGYGVKKSFLFSIPEGVKE